MSDSIKVAIKVRPLIKREITDKLPIQWMVHGNSIMPVDTELKKRGDVLHFDHIFDMAQGNIDLFEVMAKPIIDAAINGFNGTIFAYGQTSSGKTYSMMGSDENPGVIPLAINYIFDTIDKTYSREFLLRVSYLEIYNERVNDLLDKDRLDLKIKENTKTKQVIVDGCKEHVCNTPEKVLEAMKSGDNIRRTGETNMNERSSRSHTIFRITIESRESNACEGAAVHVSQLNLVDLAGSERARQTGATGERFNEGRHINLSLSTLGLVIMQLSEREENPSKFINFRDSKLTRILQDSLGGNAMTAIICAVTPAALEETQCTLAFASRAKKIKNEPQVNEVLSDEALLKRYRNQMTKLKMELEKLKSTDVGKMESELIENKRTNQILLERLALLEKSIVCGNSSSEAESFKSKAKRRRTWGGGRMLTSKSLPPINRGLPTIKELERTPEKVKKKEKIKRRQSILEQIDIHDQTFGTKFADFEVALIELERARVEKDDRDSNGSSVCDDGYFITKRDRPDGFSTNVKFQDDVAIIGGSFKSPETPQRMTPRIPECEDAVVQVELSSPGTPKSLLRNRTFFLMEQYNALRKDHTYLEEFSKLEKQMFVEEAVKLAMAEHEKALAASEQKYQEINEKYTTLESHSSAANTRLAELEQQLAESASSFKALKRENQDLIDALNKTKKEKPVVESPAINNDKEISSIFANNTYFEDMDVSDVQSDSMMVNDTQEPNTGILSTSKFGETKKSKEYSNTAYSEFIKQIGEKSTAELASVMQDLMNSKLSLEEDNTNLQSMLHRKAREADDIKNDIRELKSGIEKLQETIHLLTAENTELTSKLSTEKEHAKEAQQSLEATIIELNSTIDTITQEKTLLTSCVKDFDDQLQAGSKNISPNVEEMQKVIQTYKETIATLTAENEELSSNLMNKIEELDRIKDAKFPPGEHECAYRQLSINLSETNKLLEVENIELSNSLIEKIEKYDNVKEELDKLKLISSSIAPPSESGKLIEITGNLTSVVNSKNNKSSRETVDDLLRFSIGMDTSLYQNLEKSRENCHELALPLISTNGSISNSSEQNSTQATKENDDFVQVALAIPQESVKNEDENGQDLNSWKIKAEMLQEQVNQLNVLNSKLSELKMTTCAECAHLAELNENRKSLKLEAKTLNRKLRELQEKFDQECADSALLRTRADEDFNLSVCDLTINGSMMQEGSFNISFVEEKVQALHQELDALRDKHEKLSDLYKAKCNEIEKLHDACSRETTPTSTSTDSPRFKRNEGKLDRIQADMDKLRNDIKVFKKNIAGISAALQKFVIEKAIMQAEIETLKAEKASNFTGIMDLKKAEERVAFLENNVTKFDEEIKSSNLIAQQLEKAKISLEAEVESLKAEIVSFEKNVALFSASSLSTDQEKINSLKNDVMRLCEKINSSTVLKRQLEDTNASLEAQVQSLQAEKATFGDWASEIGVVTTEMIKCLEKKVSSLGEEISRANTDREEMANAKCSLEAEVELLKAKKAFMGEKVESTGDIAEQGKIEFLENKVALLGEEISKANADKEELMIAKSSLEAEVKALQAKKATMEEKIKSIEDIAKGEKIEFLENQVALLGKEISKANADKEDLIIAKSSLEAEVEALQAKKATIEDKIESIEDIAREEKIEFLENQVALLGDEISKANADKEELLNTKSFLKAEIESLGAKKALMEEKIKETEDKIECLEIEVARLSQENRTSNAVKEELEVAKCALESEVEFLKVEKSREKNTTEAKEISMEEKMQHLKNEVAHLKTHNANLFNEQNQQSSLETEEECFAAEKASFEKSIGIDDDSTTQETMKYLENEVSRLSEEINNSNVVKEELVSTKSSLEAEVQSLKAEKIAFDEKVTQTDGTSAQERINLLENEVTRLNGEIIHSNEVKEELESAKSSLEAEVQYLKLEKASNQSENASSEQERIALLETELIRLSDEIHGSTIVNQQAETIKSSLEAEIEALKAENKTREESMHDMIESLRNLESTNSTLKITLEKVTSEKDELVEKIATVSRTHDFPNNNDQDFAKIIETLDLKLKETGQELDKYMKINQELNNRLTAIKASEENLNCVKSQLEYQIKDLQKERTDNEANLEKLCESLEQLKDNNSSTILRLENVEGNLAESQKENTELRDKLRLLEQSEEKLTNAMLEITNLKAEIISLEDNLVDLRSTISDLQENNCRLKSELEKTEIQKENDSEREIGEASYETLKEYEKIVEELRNKVQDITNDLHANAKETADLNNQLTKLNSEKNELNDARSALESEIRSLKSERDTLEGALKDMKKTLDGLGEKNCLLDQELETLKTENQKCNKSVTENLENPRLEDYETTIDQMNCRVIEITAELNKFATENEELNFQISKLKDKLERANTEEQKSTGDGKFSESTELTSDKYFEELESARTCIKKEMKSLKPTLKINEFDDKSISELFGLFVHTIMAKEQEIIKALNDRFDREKRKLEEKNRQSCDAEKRATIWIKELETEVERMQQDLIREESKSADTTNEIAKLQNLLKESAHENQLLEEKMQVLELDFNTLQAELEKYPEAKHNVTLNSMHDKERLIQEALQTREMELSAKLRLVEKQSKEKLQELTKSLEIYKNKNLELTNNLEGLDANERQLKSIADMKSNELIKANNTIENLRKELNVLTENYNQLTQQNAEVTRQIDEITLVMKTRCDKLSEYKTKLETITPEYEILKDQAAERQLKLEKYKNEIECMAAENEKQISLLKDCLDSAEIKSAGYRKQIADLTNKNTVLQTKLTELQTKYEELELTNAKLTKSMRSSTSKIRAAEEMEDLKDQNRTLQRNLEGASNRIAHLQETKTQVLKEVVELQGKYESISMENTALKSSMSSLKSTVKQATELQIKYELLMQEKNRIALQLEDKKTTYLQLEKKHEESTKEIDQLKTTNKDLDEEMDAMLLKIEELKSENFELADKLYKLECVGSVGDTEKSNDQIEIMKTEIKNLKSQRDQSRDQLLQFENKHKESAKEMEQLKTTNKDLDEEMDMMLLKIEELKSENFELADKLYKLECAGSLGDTEKSNNQIDKMKTEIEDLKSQRDRNRDQLLELEIKHKECAQEIETLKTTNKDLDEEMDDMVGKIKELTTENFELMDKLLTIESSGALGDTKAFKDQIEKLQTEIEQVKSQRDQIRGELESATRTLESFKIENSELRVKVALLDRGDSLSCDSSRSGSPALEAVRVDNRRRRSRTELFNQKRQLDNLEMHETNCCGQCRCATLQEEVIKLERELVTKNGHIAALEIRIQSENFPHMKRCKDLEEFYDSSRRKCKKLEAELQKVREMKLTELSSECDKCRHWRSNKRDQSTQCLPPSEKLYLSGMSSGIVEDHIRMEKLRKTNDRLKEICRGRNRVVQELQNKIKELEKQLNISANQDEKSGSGGAPALCSTSKSDFAVNSRQPMKENVPIIWANQKPATQLRREWFT